MAKRKTKKKGRFVKGSPEAKAYMASIRAKSKKKKDWQGTVTTNDGSKPITGTVTAHAPSLTVVREEEETISTVKKTEVPFYEKPARTLEAEEKRLTGELQEDMPTKTEMATTPAGAVHRHINWEERNKDKIARWKEIRRELYPDDHNAANLENIRED